MSPETENLIDVRRLKRRLRFWRVLAVITILVAGGFAVFQYNEDKTGAYVAKLRVHGIIVEDLERERALDDVVSDKEAKALIVHIDSPGGTVVGGETLFEALRNVSAKKPVVAVMGAMATSAGYMTALGSDRIFARKGSLTGSIGVLLQTADVTGLMEKMGVKPETIKSGPLKAQPNPLENMSPEARRSMQEVVMDMHAMFVDLVADRRDMERENVLALADGQVMTGRKARQIGLVDAIGGEEAALDWLEEKHQISADIRLHEVKIERSRGDWGWIFDAISGKALFSERLKLDGLVSLWHPVGW